VPISFATIFRAIVLLVLTVHIFYMYCTARGMGEHFGFDLSTTIISALFALAMLVPIVWAVFLPDVPEFISQHVRPRWRWKRGQCPACSYDRRGLPNSDEPCPECGEALREPASWRVTRHTVRRFIAINVFAWMIGCWAGEVWMENDERNFRREVETSIGSASDHRRSRRWPNHEQKMSYLHGDGYFGGDKQLSRRN
jgi:hypothetical protein